MSRKSKISPEKGLSEQSQEILQGQRAKEKLAALVVYYRQGNGISHPNFNSPQMNIHSFISRNV